MFSHFKSSWEWQTRKGEAMKNFSCHFGFLDLASVYFWLSEGTATVPISISPGHQTLWIPIEKEREMPQKQSRTLKRPSLLSSSLVAFAIWQRAANTQIAFCQRKTRKTFLLPPSLSLSSFSLFPHPKALRPKFHYFFPAQKKTFLVAEKQEGHKN